MWADLVLKLHPPCVPYLRCRLHQTPPSDVRLNRSLEREREESILTAFTQQLAASPSEARTRGGAGGSVNPETLSLPPNWQQFVASKR